MLENGISSVGRSTKLSIYKYEFSLLSFCWWVLNQMVFRETKEIPTVLLTFCFPAEDITDMESNIKAMHAMRANFRRGMWQLFMG